MLSGVMVLYSNKVTVTLHDLEDSVSLMQGTVGESMGLRLPAPLHQVDISAEPSRSLSLVYGHL